MEPPGIVPTKVDRTFIKTYAGSAQPLILHALRFLGLIDPETGLVQNALKDLVVAKDKRPQLVRQLLDIHYLWLLALPHNATEQELLDAFKDHGGLEGDTRRKAAAFFLAAANYAKVPYTPLWKKNPGRPASGSPGTRRSTVRPSMPKLEA